MIIALDADGPCCNLHLPWYARYNYDYDDNLTMERVTDWNVHQFVKPECGKKIYDYLRDPTLYDEVPPVPGALEAVRTLRAAGHEIVFTTSCSWDMTDQKARWFVRHGFTNTGKDAFLPQDFISVYDKLKIDAHLLIDDRAETVQAWVEQKRRKAILFDAPHNRRLDEQVHSAFWSYCRRIGNWPAIVNLLTTGEFA